MDILKLSTRPRTGSGKKYTIKIRPQGWIPAIFYGKDQEPQKIEVNEREFAAFARNRKLTHLFDLGLGSQDKSIAVVREVQRHVLNDMNFLHIDFLHVNMNEKVIVECPVELVGTSVGVKDNNGVLGLMIKKIKIESMPADIPEKITIDVTNLDVGDSIHVRDLSFPNWTIKEAPEEVIAVVTHATREAAESTTETSAATPASGAETKAESKEKGK